MSAATATAAPTVAAPVAAPATNATNAAPATTVEDSSWRAIASAVAFVAAISMFGTSIGLIVNANTSTSDWNTIQGQVTIYTLVMGLGALCIVVGSMFYMWQFAEYSHIILAMLTALAFGISTTSLIVASVSIGQTTA